MLSYEEQEASLENFRAARTAISEKKLKRLQVLMREWGYDPSTGDNIGNISYVLHGSSRDNKETAYFKHDSYSSNAHYYWGLAALYIWNQEGVAPEIIAADPYDPNTYITKNAGYENRLLSLCDLDEMVETVIGLSKKIHIPPPPTHPGIIELLPPTLAGIYRSVDSRPLPDLPLSISDRLSWGFARAGTNNLYQEMLAHIERRLNAFSSTKGQMYLLHGDLQDKNIMETESGNLKVIDPLPCYGARESDLALWAVTLKTKHSIQKTVDTIIEKAPNLNKQALTDLAYILPSQKCDQKTTKTKLKHKTESFTICYLLIM